MPDKMPEDMSDRMPEDVPVTKRINVMVGITRSKVILLVSFFLRVCVCVPSDACVSHETPRVGFQIQIFIDKLHFVAAVACGCWNVTTKDVQ